VNRFPLARRDRYRIDLDRLAAVLRQAFNLVVLVNPNNPTTGQHVSADALQRVLTRRPARPW
jgi:histidinol-phosphate/aromatic aminotransferase/cobyric acid decarboxylase-like protein